MTDPDADVVKCYGNAKPTDTHLASTIHCIDDEIVEWLERRERRRHKAAMFQEGQLGRDSV